MILDIVKSAIKTWQPPTQSPTANGRWVGSVLEESIKEHFKKAIPSYIQSFGHATEYPDVALKDNIGAYAFEIKATEKDAHVNNRTKSPESLAKNFLKFKEHWVIAAFYRLDREAKLFSDIEVFYIELWKYTSTSFKDYSALAALGKLEYMLRTESTPLAFRSQQEFIDFFTYMSKYPGPIIQRNQLAKEWLKQHRAK